MSQTSHPTRSQVHSSACPAHIPPHEAAHPAVARPPPLPATPALAHRDFPAVPNPDIRAQSCALNISPRRVSRRLLERQTADVGPEVDESPILPLANDPPTLTHAGWVDTSYDDSDGLSYASGDDNVVVEGPPPANHPTQPPQDSPSFDNVPLSDPDETAADLSDAQPEFTIPWNESMHQDTRMSKLGLVLHTDLHFLSCVRCNLVVDPARIIHHLKKHFKRHFKTLRVTDEFCSELRTEFSLLPKDQLLNPTEIRPPIPNLKLFSDYYRCPTCNHALLRQKSFAKHRTCGKITPVPCFAQSFSHDKNGLKFGVISPDPPPAESGFDFVAAFNAKYSDIPPDQRPIEAPRHARDTSHFLRKENWVPFVSGLTGQQVWQAVREDNGDLRKILEPSVDAFYSEVNAALSVCNRPEVGEALGSYRRCVRRLPSTSAVHRPRS